MRYHLDIMTDLSKEEIIDNLSDRVFVKKIIKKNKRTLSQNSTLHGWLGVIADECQNKGLTIDVLYKEPAEMDITSDILKEYVKRIAKHYVGNEHTSKLNTKEFSKLVDLLEKIFAEKLDNQIPFDYKRFNKNL